MPASRPSPTPWRWVLTAACALNLLASPEPQARDAAPSPGPRARIGLLLPPEEGLGDSIRLGTRLGAAQARQGLRIPLELVVRGRTGQWGDDGEEAGRLALEDGVDLIIGPPGGVPAHLLLQVAGRTRTPVLQLSPETALAGAGIPWALRVVPTAAQELAALARSGSTVLVAPEGRQARELLADVTRRRRVGPPAGDPAPGHAAWISLVAIDPEAPPAPNLLGLDPAQPAPDGRGAIPDRVLLWLDPGPAAHWAQALRAAGFRGDLAGPARLRGPRFLRAAGPAAAGFQVAELDPGPEEATQREALEAFSRDFRAATGEEPDATAVAAAEAVGMAVALLRRADGEPVHTVFPVKGLGAGLTGPWRFDAAGDRAGPMRVLTWSGQGWRPLAPAPAAARDAAQIPPRKN